MRNQFCRSICHCWKEPFLRLLCYRISHKDVKWIGRPVWNAERTQNAPVCCYGNKYALPQIPIRVEFLAVYRYFREIEVLVPRNVYHFRQHAHPVLNDWEPMSDMVENDPGTRTTHANASFGVLPGEWGFQLQHTRFSIAMNSTWVLLEHCMSCICLHDFYQSFQTNATIATWIRHEPLQRTFRLIGTEWAVRFYCVVKELKNELPTLLPRTGWKHFVNLLTWIVKKE
jgi:hypothetical protein